jgi:hypothetical protein
VSCASASPVDSDPTLCCVLGVEIVQWSSWEGGREDRGREQSRADGVLWRGKTRMTEKVGQLTESERERVCPIAVK